MAQFDTYDNPSPAQREVFPFVVVLQSDQLDHLNTRLVMPLARHSSPPKAAPRRLAQAVDLQGERLWLAPHLVAALPERLLRRPRASLREERHRFLDALDAVISGA
jgi:toxin CcdB